jgi:two-component system copper resistance phosphate regulon response regulator CusR
MMLEHVWDSNVDSFTNVIDVHVKYLRDRIDKKSQSKLIKTVHGLGYKIEDEHSANEE